MREQATGTIFRDILMQLLARVVFFVVILLPLITISKAQKVEGIQPPGNVIVDARWADGLNEDVDLWVQAPGDVPVGYSNKGGLIFNLLRDDLGSFGDPTNLNLETAYSRGIPPGEYTVNLHLYRHTTAVLPLPVEVTVTVRPDGKDAEVILHKTVALKFEGQELTVFRFRLSAKGELDDSSVTDLFKPLRAKEMK